MVAVATRTPSRRSKSSHQTKITTVVLAKARVIWQDPAREAFILRHMPGCATRRPLSTEIAMRQLLKQWPEYEKTLSAAQLATRIDLGALRRAARVESELAAFFSSIELF